MSSAEKMVRAKVAVDLARGKLISALRKYELPADVAELLVETDKASAEFYEAWIENERQKSAPLLKQGKKGGK